MTQRIDPAAARALVPPPLAAILEEVYAVGGCVRDAVMGRTPNDIDLTTPLTPQEVIAAGEAAGYQVKPTGLQHGTVTVIIDHEPYEVTTFRIDTETDGRHAKVQYTRDLSQDLARRDFTMNAMAVDVYGELFDPYGGQADIDRKVIRCVGNPFERFEEDLLRIVRAARFSSTLGFEIDPETQEAMRKMGPELQAEVGGKVSIERMVIETNKALKGSERPSEYLQWLWDLGVFQKIIPEMANADDLAQDPKHHPEGSVWRHTLDVIDRADPAHRWNALFHDIGKCITFTPTEQGYNTFRGHDEAGANVIKDICSEGRLNLPKTLIRSIEATTGMHMQVLQAGDVPTDRVIRRLQHRAGPHLDSLAGVVRADAGHRYNPGWDALWAARQDENGVDDVKPILTGHHLLARGHKQSVELGQILKRAHEHQLETGERDVERLYQIGLGTPPTTTAGIADDTIRLAIVLEHKQVYDLADRLDDLVDEIN